MVQTIIVSGPLSGGQIIGARNVGKGRQLEAIGPIHDLGIDLLARGFLVRGLIHEQILSAVMARNIGRQALILAGVEAYEGARGLLAADGLADLQAQILARVAAGVDHRAAQIAG